MRQNYCKNCHWFKETDPFKLMSNGKFLPCSNIGVDGWEHWAEHQTEPEHCDGYCTRGAYVPTGVWADVAKVVDTVAAKIKEDA